jgi:hypothetical protein
MLLSNGKDAEIKKKFRGREIRPGFTQFVPALTAEVVGVLDYFSGFCNDE